jgi:hypothetical protein
MANKLLNFRCPEPLLDAIDKIGQEYYPADNDSGCDRSKTLIEILHAGVEALTNDDIVLPRPSDVRPDVRQVSETDIKAMVEAAIEEKLAQTTAQPTVQIPPNIPTQNQFHELKERVNDYKLSLLREIQNRDKGISLLAEQVAELTARLDTMPEEGISRDELEAARDKVLHNWRVAKGAEKRDSASAAGSDRVGLAIDKFIDIISPTPTPQHQTELQTDSMVVRETDNFSCRS